MGAILKIKFEANKRQIKPFWIPVVLELQPHGSDETFRFGIEDLENDVMEDPLDGKAFFKVQGLQNGHYHLKVVDSHMGHAIAHESDFEIEGAEVEYSIARGQAKGKDVTFQPNTYGMDLIADAPFRIERSYPYVPIIVYIKDVDPGEIKIKSIEIHSYVDSSENKLRLLEPDSIFKVLDHSGNEVVKNGRPSFLRLDEGKEYETVMPEPSWWRLIFVKKEKFETFHGKHLGYETIDYLKYRVKINYRVFLKGKKRFDFRTILSRADLPKVKDWYYGDTHYHSEFTNNPYEYGGPLTVTAEVARALGLSWVTVTDHSYGLSRPKNPSEQTEGNRWKAYQKAVRVINSRYEDVLLVGAEEITVKKNVSGLHMLSFNNPFIEDHHYAGFGTFTMQEVFDKLVSSSEKNGGIIYAAHPSSHSYIWEESDYQIATNPKYNSLFTGLQIFNEKIEYSKTTQSTMDVKNLNPFEMLDETSRQRPWSKELRKGIRDHWVKRFLMPQLRSFSEKKDLRKYFIIAGSDAHMDFNFSFRPHPAFLIHHLNDNAFGKVRTLAYFSDTDGRALTEKNLYQALREGKTLLTDGPVAIFHLEHEGSENIYRFGDTLTLSRGSGFVFSLQWQSNEDYGPIQGINLYVGTSAGEKDISSAIGLPDFKNGDAGFKGQLTHQFTDWNDSPCYLRLEAVAGVEPESGEGRFICLTNPIWIVTQ